MAEWTKFEDGLADKREVLAISRAIGMHPERVACKLMAVWAWARRNSTDGVLHGVCIEDIDKPAGKPGFGKAMAAPDVMWAMDTPDGIVFPKWERHNSNGAKKRAEDARRKEDGRKSDLCPKQNGHFADKTRTRLEEEGEKKRFEGISSSASARARAEAASEPEQPITDFHLRTLETVEGVFGTLSPSNRRRVAEWTLSIEASESLSIDGEPVLAISIAEAALGEAVRAEANGTVKGFLAFADAIVSRCRRQGVRPGEARPLKAGTFPVAASPYQREDFDGCLPGETTAQALIRKGKM